MGCGCDKSGSVGMIKLFGGSRSRRLSRTRRQKSRRTKQPRRRKRNSRSMRGGNLGDQMKSLMNISTSGANNPASQHFGKGNAYFV